MYCAYCGNEVGPTDLVCVGCGIIIDRDGVTSENPAANQPEPPREEKRNPILVEFIPTSEERKVRCNRCGGENHRGDYYCLHCGKVLVEMTEHDEIVTIDDENVRKINPRTQILYLKVACQLYTLKMIKKIGTYQCQNPIELKDGKIDKCKAMLTMDMPRCPRCKQPNEIVYNCKHNTQKEPPNTRCDGVVTLDMLKCPKCGDSTVLADFMSVLSGMTFGEESVKFVNMYFQQDFPTFHLVKSTYPIIIPHENLSTIKMETESWCNRLSKILVLLATFLDIVTARRNSGNMQSIFQFNPAAFFRNIQSPQPSTDLTTLLDERAEHAQQEVQVAAAAQVGDDDGNDSPDNPFDLSI